MSDRKTITHFGKIYPSSETVGNFAGMVRWQRQIYERGRCRLLRYKVVTNIFPRESVLLGLEPDILSQKHVSMIPRHCRVVLEVCTVFSVRFVGVRGFPGAG